MGYEFLKKDWESRWAPYRDLIGWVVGLAVLDGPGLYWLYVLVDSLRSAESRAFWFGPTPTGEPSVFVNNVGAVVLFVLWTALVLALFARPVAQTASEIRG
ncbi:hypothetical protein [Halorussus pelagicus]|uniref:hypothetical protein n=1 Tax=Halorussus pelagicus TaxID=2505977 RepID=UPI000FFC0FD3|nr:hypothetical protein [Halorussus pelagicus]